jgi:hypothetical protein
MIRNLGKDKQDSNKNMIKAKLAFNLSDPIRSDD